LDGDGRNARDLMLGRSAAEKKKDPRHLRRLP
jgi:hypothetical protein